MNDAATEQSLKMARVVFYGSIEIVERGIQIAFAISGYASIMPGRGRSRVESDGEIVICDRAFEFAFRHPRVAAFNIRKGGVCAGSLRLHNPYLRHKPE